MEAQKGVRNCRTFVQTSNETKEVWNQHLEQDSSVTYVCFRLSLYCFDISQSSQRLSASEMIDKGYIRYTARPGYVSRPGDHSWGTATPGAQATFLDWWRNCHCTNLQPPNIISLALLTGDYDDLKSK